MRTLASILISAILLAPQVSDRQALKLKPGDLIVVTSPYGGEFPIQSDGAIYGRGFGRIVLEGRTCDQAQADMRKALKKLVREDEVYVFVKEIRSEVVYLVGMSGGRGRVEMTPDMTLRQLLSSAQLTEDTDQIEAQVFRGGEKIRTANVGALMSGYLSEPDSDLKPNDVVSLAPIPQIRVWVLGLVLKSGEVRLPAGTDAHRAVAAAGGFAPQVAGERAPTQDEARIIVKRGPETFDLPFRTDSKARPFELEAGDTVSVVGPEVRRVTVVGEVVRPGEVVLRGQETLLAAVAAAGGLDVEGTLSRVLVMRKGELFQVDGATTPSQSAPPFSVEAGDLVYVQRNERTYYVLGEVGRPGKFFMRDGQGVRAADALANASGLSSKGTLRRVYLARADATGKTVVRQFNLDAFLKDGDEENNPEILPGDCLLFSQPKGLTFAAATQALSAAILFENLVRK